MRLCKPEWVCHEGKPIFSIDIHPDGSRFATGGQGDSSGKISIWNMAPVRSVEEEKNENTPKLLCKMDNHLGENKTPVLLNESPIPACVNCVRWSHNGKYLASCGDDKLVMIWTTTRYGGISTTFGGVNLEQWRCSFSLRGHNGDVLDLSWSENDQWLASCSIDNAIIVWNALKFPEQLAQIRGHTGLVKGVAWDPVGKYLASQSDDRTIRVWRTHDWKQEACVSKPFQECGGTTHVLRLGWSPDGHYLVSAHAMNNSGPVAQIIERSGWKTGMDFVGHRKAVNCVRFNSKIFAKEKKGHKKQHYSCCAIGSKDRSISIWLTVLKRPLVVVHDLFTSSVIDISWAKNGLSLLCCSADGSVGYLDFDVGEVGVALTDQQMYDYHKTTYGKSMLSNIAQDESSSAATVIESAEMLKLQRQQKEESEVPQMVNEVSQSSLPANTTNKQIETRTKDGKRRITPIFLASQPSLKDGAVAPVPFGSNQTKLQPSEAIKLLKSSQPTFSSSKDSSMIEIEKQNTPPSSGSKVISSDTLVGKTDGIVETSPFKPLLEQPVTSTPVESSTAIESLKRKLPEPVHDISKKKDGRGRPKKDKVTEPQRAIQQAPPLLTPVVSAREDAQNAAYIHGIELPTPSRQDQLSIQVDTTVGFLQYDVDNDVSDGGFKVPLLSCTSGDGGGVRWTSALPAAAQLISASKSILSVCCEDRGVRAFNTTTGTPLLPPIVVDATPCILHCSTNHIMVITRSSALYIWNVRTQNATIRQEAIEGLITQPSVRLTFSAVTESGQPVLRFNDGRSYTYHDGLGAWVLLEDAKSAALVASDETITNTTASSKQGILATQQINTRNRPGCKARELFRTQPEVKRTCTVTHLQDQMSRAQLLGSAEEYKQWLMAMARYLIHEGFEQRLRILCEDLMGPVVVSRNATSWQSEIMGMKKRDLLREILPLFGLNMKIQRLYRELSDQLESLPQS